jgi:hypothetical protein
MVTAQHRCTPWDLMRLSHIKKAAEHSCLRPFYKFI